MKKISKDIQKKIDELSDLEKQLVVDYILADFDKPDPEIDKLWAKEALRRQKAMRSGKMKTHSYDDVMRKYLKWTLFLVTPQKLNWPKHLNGMKFNKKDLGSDLRSLSTSPRKESQYFRKLVLKLQMEFEER